MSANTTQAGRNTGIKRMLINATQPDELRVAITEDSQLVDFDREVPGQEQKMSFYFSC